MELFSVENDGPIRSNGRSAAGAAIGCSADATTAHASGTRTGRSFSYHAAGSPPADEPASIRAPQLRDNAGAAALPSDATLSRTATGQFHGHAHEWRAVLFTPTIASGAGPDASDGSPDASPSRHESTQHGNVHAESARSHESEHEFGSQSFGTTSAAATAAATTTAAALHE